MNMCVCKGHGHTHTHIELKWSIKSGYYPVLKQFHLMVLVNGTFYSGIYSISTSAGPL